MRGAALVCLGAGAGLIRADLREVHGSDVITRSGGVIVQVRGARERTVPVLPRYHEPLLAAAASAGDSLVLCGTDPGRRNLTNPLVKALDGGGGLPGWTPAGSGRPGRAMPRGCSGWPRSCTPPGSPVPSVWVTWSPGWSRPARLTRSGCSEHRGSHDRAAGAGGDHRPLRHRAADPSRRCSPSACAPGS
jgi:hypothetical protein